MEVSLCQQSPGHRDALAKMSQEYGLLASQGSDFHYPGNWRELGKIFVCQRTVCQYGSIGHSRRIEVRL